MGDDSGQATLTASLDVKPREERSFCEALVLALRCDRPLAPPARFALDELDRVHIGRGPQLRLTRRLEGGLRQLDIEVPDPRMSGRHARLCRDLERWVLEDQGSKNGVLWNGRATQRALLAPGDLCELGRTLFLFSRRSVPPARARGELPVPDELPGLRTLLPDLAETFREVAAIAPSTVPITILGESGTGKELLAHAIHALSRRTGPLVPVNCGALPGDLVESELFGHRKGAFSGALADQPGLVRAASGGTLLLDELGDFPLASQAALLRVLQEREVLPVGATRPLPVDVRFVSATHRDLGRMVEDGAFRADLYARIAAFTVALPPLRERREDLGLILGQLLARAAPEHADRVSLTGPAARGLLRHHWPFNIRELEHTLKSALALAPEGRIDVTHLPPAVQVAAEGTAPPPSESGEAELRAELVQLLGQHRGNVSAMARHMGKARMQIQRWLRRFGLDPASYR